MAHALRLDSDAPYRHLIGVGGIGTGMFFRLEGDHTLGRSERREAKLLDVRDYCKLHIIAHYVAVLTGARPEGSPFHVLPVGKVGSDVAGEELRREMTEAGMDLRMVSSVEGKPTMLSVCFRYPDGSGGSLATSDSAASVLSHDDLVAAEQHVAESGSRCIVLAAPEVPLALRAGLLEVASRHGALRVAAFASTEIAEARRIGMLANVDLLAVNEDEAAALLGREFDGSKQFLKDLAAAAGELNPGMRVLLSAGLLGAWGYADGNWVRCPAAKVQAVSTAGAGDALLGATLALVAAGVPFIGTGEERASLADRPLDSALEFGVLLAGYSVTGPHLIHHGVNLDTVMKFADQLGVHFSDELLAVFG